MRTRKLFQITVCLSFFVMMACILVFGILTMNRYEGMEPEQAKHSSGYHMMKSVDAALSLADRFVRASERNFNQ